MSREGKAEPIEEEEESMEEEEEEPVEEKKSTENNLTPDPLTSPSPPRKVSVTDTIKYLRDLDSKLTDFFNNFNDLDQTLTTIATTIIPKTPQINTQITKKPLPKTPQKTTSKSMNKQITNRSLDSICESMDAPALRAHICKNHDNILFFDMVGDALHVAPDPARLVLSTVHEFLLRTPGEVYKHLALLLEIFLVSFERAKPDESLREEADEVVLKWRERIEGRMGNDVRDEFLGLALFVACFGVPEEFGVEYLCCLLGGNNLKKRHVFRRSYSLFIKMPDIVKYMLTADMEGEAVDLICTFGLENEFPVLPLLSSYVSKMCNTEVEESGNQSSKKKMRKAIWKKIEALKYVQKCANRHNLDKHAISSLKIDDNINKLQMEAKKFAKGEKRGWDQLVETEPRRSLHPTKRSQGKIDEPSTGHATKSQTTCHSHSSPETSTSRGSRGGTGGKSRVQVTSSRRNESVNAPSVQPQYKTHHQKYPIVPHSSGTPYAPYSSRTPYSLHNDYCQPSMPPAPYPSAYMYQQPRQAFYGYYPPPPPLPCEPHSSVRNFPQQAAASCPPSYRSPVKSNTQQARAPYPPPDYGSNYPYNR